MTATVLSVHTVAAGASVEGRCSREPGDAVRAEDAISAKRFSIEVVPHIVRGRRSLGAQ